MEKNLQSKFSPRQYMLSRDFEIYYYNEPGSAKVQLHTHNYYEFYFFLEGDVSILIEKKEYPLKYGDMVLIPPGVPHQALIHDTNMPYRRFVFWISVDYCNQLINLSPSYGYVMQNVAVKKNYIFHNDLITFNTIQYRIFQLIEETRSDRFGKDAKITLCVNELVLHLNRIAYEQQNPKSEKESQNLYQSLVYYIDTIWRGAVLRAACRTFLCQQVPYRPCLQRTDGAFCAPVYPEEKDAGVEGGDCRKYEHYGSVYDVRV